MLENKIFLAISGGIMNHKKAQVFSADMVFSFLIFLTVLSLATFLWICMPAPDETKERAENVADYLLMKRLGSENMLNQQKLDNFSAMSHNEMKNELGIPENIYFNVFSVSSLLIKEGGLKPDNANLILNIRRIGMLDGNYVYLDTILWK